MRGCLTFTSCSARDTTSLVLAKIDVKYMIDSGHRRFPRRQASWSANLDSFEVSIVIDEYAIASAMSGNSARGFRAPSCSYIAPFMLYRTS